LSEDRAAKSKVSIYIQLRLHQIEEAENVDAILKSAGGSEDGASFRGNDIGRADQGTLQFVIAHGHKISAGTGTDV
jgi:hypothetical protein